MNTTEIKLWLEQAEEMQSLIEKVADELRGIRGNHSGGYIDGIEFLNTTIELSCARISK